MIIKDSGKRVVANQVDTSSIYDFLAGGGEMGERIRTKDWSKTPLGPVEQWPQSLRTSVSILLASRFPMIIFWGPELIQFYNDPYRPMLGSTKHPNALGQSAQECWPEIWNIIGPMLEGVLATGEATWSDNQLLLMNRNDYVEECYFTFSYSPIRDESGGIGGVFCAVTETSGQVVGERHLQTLRELAAETVDARTIEEACRRASRSLEHNPHDLPFAMIYLIDKAKSEVYLTGVSNIEKGHKAVPEKVSLDYGSIWPFKQVSETSSPTLITGLEKYFDNLPTGAWEYSPYQAVAVPIAPTGETGQAGILIVGLNPFQKYDEGYQGFIKLVSGQITSSIANAQAYEEERKRAEALAEIDRAKTTFFSNVSHEFRTPLTLMLGPIEDTLAEKDTLTKEQQERTEILHRNSLRLLRLVNALLDFSRIEAGRVQAVYEPTNLATFTTELASSFHSAIEKAGMELVVEAGPLPEPVYVDREMWEKIVLNLLSNAFKYTLKGSIRVSLQQREDRIELSVSDTGVGIPAAEMPHLFERFHRVEGVEGRAYEGTGIGLALVQELVKLHGGVISARSTLGEGTTFTVSIPVGSSHLPQEHILGHRSQSSTAVSARAYVEETLRWLPGHQEVGEFMAGLPVEEEALKEKPANGKLKTLPRILLVDDNADMREYVKRLLSQKYEVEAVPDGNAALEAIGQSKPDLVLTDVMMPKLDGFGLLKALRQNPATKTLPVIMLSARAGEEARIEGLQEGADDYLIKPFSSRELLARVGAHLALARVRQESQESEEKYRTLFETMEQGFCILEILYDEQHQPVDYRLLEVNPTFEKQSSIKDAAGKTIRQLVPEVDNRWIEMFAKVAESGQPTRVTQLSRLKQRWFEIYAFPLGGAESRKVALLFSDVTDRQKAEQLIDDERQRLYQLFLQAPAVIAILRGPTHVFELANPMYMQLVGQGRDIIGKPVLEALPEIESQGFAKLMDNVYNTGEPFIGNEIPVLIDRSGDGTLEEVYLNFVYQPYRTDTGQIQGILVHAVDVTEQVKARQRVEEQNRVLEMITSGASLTEALEFLVKSIEKQSGHGMQASILLLDNDGKHLKHGAAPSLPQEYNEAINGIEIGPAVGSCGTAAYTKNPVIVSDITNDPLWKDFKDLAARHNLRACWSTPIFASDQSVLGTFAMYYHEPRTPNSQDRQIIDFATRTAALAIERKKAEEAIKESEERFRTLADNISQLAWMTDETGSIYWYNRRWYEYTGTTFEEMQGWGWQKVHHPAHIKRVVEKISHHFQTGEDWEDTFPLRGKDGEYRWFLSRAIPIRDENGRVLRWFGTNTDITERLQLEERRNEFIGIASHELKTPLTSIKGYTQLLERLIREMGNEKANLYLAKTSIYIERLNSLIADLLDVSRIQAGKLQFNISEFDFDGLVKEAVESIQPTTTHHRIEVVGKANTLISADRNRLEQVLTNLLTNAIKYSPQADKVVVAVKKNRASVEVAVQDFGIGIAKENQSKLFERFYRVDSSAKQFSGLGIGLYISSEIIKRHSGDLRVESEEGRGSIFTFTLPLTQTVELKGIK